MRFPDYEHSTQTNTPPEAETATVEQILEAYNKGNLDTLLNVLARRPRELAQQLNRICRAFPAEVERVAVVLQQVGYQLPVEPWFVCTISMRTPPVGWVSVYPWTTSEWCT